MVVSMRAACRKWSRSICGQKLPDSMVFSVGGCVLLGAVGKVSSDMARLGFGIGYGGSGGQAGGKGNNRKSDRQAAAPHTAGEKVSCRLYLMR